MAIRKVKERVIVSKTEQQLKDHIEELSALYEVGKSITSALDLDEALHLITEKAAHIMKAKVCSLRLLHESKKELILKASYGLNERYRRVKESIRIGESIAGRVILKCKPYIVNDLLKERRYKCPQFAIRKRCRSLLTVPLIERDNILGVLSVYNPQPYFYKAHHVRLLSMFGSQAAIVIENARLFEQVHINYLNVIKVLTNIIDARDNYTYGHSERVMKHALVIADELRLGGEEKELVGYASFLHDLGKIGIDNEILKKAGKLTKREWKEIRLHPRIGAEIVKEIGFLSKLVPIIYHHHERYAGGGYPDPEKKGKNIPMGARILAVADAFEAMISKRPYRKALSKESAIKELRRCSGTQFDPRVVSAFLKAVQRKNR